MADAALTLRPAVEQDARSIWEWRNDPQSRAWSTDASPVSWRDHLEWFARAIVDPARRLLVLSVPADGGGETPAGVVRYDALREPGHWRVSINLAPEARGRGIGRRALLESASWLCDRERVVVLVADVAAANLASVRTFEAVGYRLTRERDGWRRYERADL